MLNIITSFLYFISWISGVDPDSKGNSKYKISKIHVTSSDHDHSGNPQAQTEGVYITLLVITD